MALCICPTSPCLVLLPFQPSMVLSHQGTVYVCSCVCVFRLMYVNMLVLIHITVRLRRITSCVVICNTVPLKTGAFIGLELATYAILAAREHSTLQGTFQVYFMASWHTAVRELWTRRPNRILFVIPQNILQVQWIQFLPWKQKPFLIEPSFCSISCFVLLNPQFKRSFSLIHVKQRTKS